MTSIVALACPGTADDAPSPLHARIAAAGIRYITHVKLPHPDTGIPVLVIHIPDLELLAVDRDTPATDSELARQLDEVLGTGSCSRRPVTGADL